MKTETQGLLRRILVAQTTYLGDLVLSTPLLRHLKNAVPQATISVLVNSGLESIFAHSPIVDGVIVFEKARTHAGLGGLLRMANDLRRRDFDAALVLPGSVRTAMAVRIAGIPRRIGTTLSSGMALFANEVRYPRESWKSTQGFLTASLDSLWGRIGKDHSIASELFTDIVRPDPSLPAVQRHLQLLGPLGIEARDDLSRPLLVPGEYEQNTIASLIAPLQGKTRVALAPGSRWPTKRWEREHWVALGQMLVQEGAAVVLLGGNDDRESCEYVDAALDPADCLNLCGLLTVLESCELLRRCSVLVSNDSAPVHLAAAMETPTIALLGPTVSRFGFVVPSPNLRIVEQIDLACRPCTPHGGDRCPIGTHECMTAIAPQRVLSAVHDYLKTK
jgi:heptosyltransferase II